MNVYVHNSIHIIYYMCVYIPVPLEMDVVIGDWNGIYVAAVMKHENTLKEKR
jgi:hypothetical protein